MKRILFLLAVSVIGFSARDAGAQSSGRFTLARSVIAGGGATFSTSGPFQLGGTIGQPLASPPGTNRFSIRGGFWIWPAPVIFAPKKAGDNFQFSFQSEPGKVYIAQYTDALTPAWQSLPDVMGDGAVQTVTNAAPGVTKRFYRLVEQ